MTNQNNFVPYATAADGTILHWQEFFPQGGDPHPAVVLLPGGGFHALLSIPSFVMADLTAAGFAAFAQTQYRIAPPNKLPGQVTDGRFPDQTNDVALAIAAAAAQPQCTGEVFVVGGSAGASHALWLAANKLVKAAVCLSPATQLDDPVSLKNGTFHNDVTNYAPNQLAEASPNNQIVTDEPPVFIIAFARDNMPAPQFSLAVDKLQTLGASYESLSLAGAGHSWDAWRVTGVPAQVIAFLNQNR